MYILDANGEMLERNLNLAKIDVVLGGDFIYKVMDSDDLAVVVKNYDHQCQVEIRPHDIRRARHLKSVLDHHQAKGVQGITVDYYADTLAVIYAWCSKYRQVYMERYCQEAFSDFYSFCRHTDAWSIIGIDKLRLEPIFTYIFCRDSHTTKINTPGH